MANRYLDIQILSGSALTDPRYYKSALYPEIEPTEDDTYIITTSDDRLDLLAYDFYGDASLWWVISTANNFPGNSMYVERGIQVRIPSNVQDIMNNFRRLNKTR